MSDDEVVTFLLPLIHPDHMSEGSTFYDNNVTYPPHSTSCTTTPNIGRINVVTPALDSAGRSLSSEVQCEGGASGNSTSAQSKNSSGVSSTSNGVDGLAGGATSSSENLEETGAAPNPQLSAESGKRKTYYGYVVENANKRLASSALPTTNASTSTVPTTTNTATITQPSVTHVVRGTLYYSTGEVYRGEIWNGEPHGQGTRVRENGEEQGLFVNGKLVLGSAWKTYHDDSGVKWRMEADIIDGLPHGTSTAYASTGATEDVVFCDGKITNRGKCVVISIIFVALT